MVESSLLNTVLYYCACHIAAIETCRDPGTAMSKVYKTLPGYLLASLLFFGFLLTSDQVHRCLLRRPQGVQGCQAFMYNQA